MISIEQIDGEIAALEEEKPTHVIMQKLASLYTVRDHMVLDNKPVLSNAAPVVPQFNTTSEFGDVVIGKRISDIMPVMDELMTTLQIVNPALYNSVIRSLP